MRPASRPFELKEYPTIARAIKILAWVDSLKSFPTADQFQDRFGGSIATAHRMLNAVEMERGIDRPRLSNAGRAKGNRDAS